MSWSQKNLPLKGGWPPRIEGPSSLPCRVQSRMAGILGDLAQECARLAQELDVHGAGMPVAAAGTGVLRGGASHCGRLLCRDGLSQNQPTIVVRCGGGLNPYHRAGADAQ
jgi:hypothetical protein